MTQSPSTLELLEHASNEDLEPLVGYIRRASVSEWLTSSDEYKSHYPNHTRYAAKIYAEIRLFGGNTVVNLARRGRGPEYNEVLADAAKKVGVKNVKGVEILVLEQEMLECILRKAAKKAESDGDEDLKRKLYEAGVSSKDYSAFMAGSALAGVLAGTVYREVMARVSVYVARVVAEQLLRTGLSAGASAVAARAGAVPFGPIGWVVAGLWTAVDIAGPAFRVTMPCTLHIAMLRQQWLCEQAGAPLERAFDD